MKLFRCFINAGDHIFEAFATGKNKKAMLDVYGGNGDFEKVDDVTNNYLNEKSLERLESDLQNACWGKGEVALITGLVQEHLTSRK